MCVDACKCSPRVASAGIGSIDFVYGRVYVVVGIAMYMDIDVDFLSISF